MPVGVKLPLMVSTPGLKPGATVPVPLTLPVIVPVPPKVPGLVTRTLLVSEPFTFNRPAVMFVPPPAEFVPVKLVVPPPIWLMMPEPVTPLPTVIALERLKAKVALLVTAPLPSVPVVPALPICSVPAATVVMPE